MLSFTIIIALSGQALLLFRRLTDTDSVKTATKYRWIYRHFYSVARSVIFINHKMVEVNTTNK